MKGRWDEWSHSAGRCKQLPSAPFICLFFSAPPIHSMNWLPLKEEQDKFTLSFVGSFISFGLFVCVLFFGRSHWRCSAHNQPKEKANQTKLHSFTNERLPFIPFGAPPAFISFILFINQIKLFNLMEEKNEFPREPPIARQPFLLFFILPIRKRRMKRKEEGWMGWACRHFIHKSIFFLRQKSCFVHSCRLVLL